MQHGCRWLPGVLRHPVAAPLTAPPSPRQREMVMYGLGDEKADQEGRCRGVPGAMRTCVSIAPFAPRGQNAAATPSTPPKEIVRRKEDTAVQENGGTCNQVERSGQARVSAPSQHDPNPCNGRFGRICNSCSGRLGLLATGASWPLGPMIAGPHRAVGCQRSVTRITVACRDSGTPWRPLPLLHDEKARGIQDTRKRLCRAANVLYARPTAHGGARSLRQRCARTAYATRGYATTSVSGCKRNARTAYAALNSARTRLQKSTHGLREPRCTTTPYPAAYNARRARSQHEHPQRLHTMHSARASHCVRARGADAITYRRKLPKETYAVNRAMPWSRS